MDTQVGAPGTSTPWPRVPRWSVTRRLLAAWRWEWERGENSEAARNAWASIERRLAALGVTLDG